MLSWLDGLGWAKWPSLLLIASPIPAYPFWFPQPVPAEDCGLVVAQGRTFRAFRAPDGSELVLRPTLQQATAAPVLRDAEPIGFDAGGMKLDPQQAGAAELACTPARR